MRAALVNPVTKQVVNVIEVPTADFGPKYLTGGLWIIEGTAGRAKRLGWYDPGVPELFAPEQWANGTVVDPETGEWPYQRQGQLVWHSPTGQPEDGRAWRNLLPTGTPNVWEPGVANWREYPLSPDGTAVWLQPTGAFDAYALGFVVEHNGYVWVSNVEANVWEPGGVGVRQWDVLEPVDPGPPPEPQEWVQPLGSEDAYSADAVVTHLGLLWQSDLDANVWEPGVFGWTEITAP